MARPREDRQARRAQLAEVAFELFERQGVQGTTVASIVAAAGVAQGTFYVYFDSKDDLILQVASILIDGMAAEVDEVVAAPHVSAVDKLRALLRALTRPDAPRGRGEIVDLIHRPENRELHDKLTADLGIRLRRALVDIIEEGNAEGSFAVPDVDLAAGFVLGGLRSLETAGTRAEDLPAAVTRAMAYVLRTLGSRDAEATMGGHSSDGRGS